MARTSIESRFYSARQASRLSKLSAYMIDYLCRTDLVVPSGNRVRGYGRRRQYTFADIVLLRVLSCLLEQGISVLRLRKSLLAARRRQLDVRGLLARRYFVTDGASVYLKDERVLETIDSGQLSFAFILDLAPIRNDLIEAVQAAGGANAR